MNATKGYFCLVQYCPDIARQEAVNVGVVLFCPEYKFIQAKMVQSNQRIRKFFGEESDNYKHLNSMKDALSNRIEVERAEFESLESLQTFVSTRANKILLTKPKPVKVFNPLEDLDALYVELVLCPQKPLSVQSKIPLRKRLDDVFSDQSIRALVRQNIKVQVPTIDEALDIPYGYQNGRLNLIQPVTFTQQSEGHIKNAACKHAMEGLSLYKHEDSEFGQLQLIVVADFCSTKPKTAEVVRNILREGHVKMFTPETLEVLKNDIIQHAKPVHPGELFN